MEQVVEDDDDDWNHFVGEDLFLFSVKFEFVREVN